MIRKEIATVTLGALGEIAAHTARAILAAQVGEGQTSVTVNGVTLGREVLVVLQCLILQSTQQPSPPPMQVEQHSSQIDPFLYSFSSATAICEMWAISDMFNAAMASSVPLRMT